MKVLEYTKDVYDITVEDNPNFALSAGVFVHNSKDSADGVCGALYNASLHAEEFSYDYGESLETLVDFNDQKDVADDYVKNFEEALKQKPRYLKDENVFDLFEDDSVSFDIYNGILN